MCVPECVVLKPYRSKDTTACIGLTSMNMHEAIGSSSHAHRFAI